MEEKIKNKVVLGELGHPADRTETDITQAAIALAEKPKFGKDGKLYGVFDILNTPNGKILKTLCDYGTTIGVSSRGEGDVIEDYEGNEAVDPDTYSCETWDAVLLPAVKEARMSYVTEALNKKKYNKTLRQKLSEEIDKAEQTDKKIMEETLDKLNISLNESDTLDESAVESSEYTKVLKAIHDAIKDDDDIESLKEYLKDIIGYCHKMADDYDIELNEDLNTEECENKETQKITEEVVDNQSDDILTELQEALKDKAELEESIAEVQNKLAVSDAKVESLEEELNKYKVLAGRLSSKAKESKGLSEKINKLEESISDSEKTIKQLKAARVANATKTKSLTESISKEKEDKQKLSEDLKTAKGEVEKLTEELNDVKADLDIKEKQAKQKAEKLMKVVEAYKKVANDTMKRYIESKATMYGLSFNEVRNRLPKSYSADDVDSVCESLRKYNINVNTLPVGIKPRIRFTESRNDNLRIENEADEINDELMEMAGLN